MLYFSSFMKTPMLVLTKSSSLASLIYLWSLFVKNCVLFNKC
jgi:hypothetical protein